MLGYDPAALSGATELDSDMAEKLAAMTASMNAMEDLQLRSKMLEEMYRGSLPGSSKTAETKTVKEPGERSPHTSKRKSATVTRAIANGDEELPEDLSMKSRRSITPKEASRRSVTPGKRSVTPKETRSDSPQSSRTRESGSPRPSDAGEAIQSPSVAESHSPVTRENGGGSHSRLDETQEETINNAGEET